MTKLHSLFCRQDGEAVSESALFLKSAEVKAADQSHRRRLLKVIGNYEAQVISQKNNQFTDWQAVREVAAGIKGYAIDNLSVLLEQFEREITAHGTTVLWARTSEEARAHFLEICHLHGCKLVVKSKSMITEEIGLNDLIEANGMEVVESDLGELIQQLSGEKAYHIVTPAMHRSIGEISELFQRKLGAEPSRNAEELTMTARAHLRRTYLEASIGVSGANFLVADIGAVSITENEGNALLTTACPPVHVVFAGIEKILPRGRDLSLFLPLLSTSGTGQKMTVYNSLLRGPCQVGNRSGPQAMYVVLIDNGRSELAAKPKFRQALRCIRCGACLNACPVYRTVGGHSYNTTYQGPIGSIITPHLRGMASWNHLSFASSLCGACTDSCPVGIPLAHMLLENRKLAVESGVSEQRWTMLLKVWAAAVRWRKFLRPLRPVFRLAVKWLSQFRRRHGYAGLIIPAAETFSAQFKRRRPRSAEGISGLNEPVSRK